MTSFNAYLIGAIILIAGLATGAILLGVPAQWIGVGAIVLIGIGVMSAVSHGKRRDLPEK